MSSKPNSNESAETKPDGNSAHEEIRGRAYELYRKRGGQPGGEMNDWQQAEREHEGGVLRARRPSRHRMCATYGRGDAYESTDTQSRVRDRLGGRAPRKRNQSTRRCARANA